jgi:hypothetical protein
MFIIAMFAGLVLANFYARNCTDWLFSNALSSLNVGHNAISDSVVFGFSFAVLSYVPFMVIGLVLGAGPFALIPFNWFLISWAMIGVLTYMQHNR